MFISFEGGEGSSKSTQCKLLQNKLQAILPYEMLAIQEPGTTQGGLDIRKLLVQGSDDRWSPISELLLFCAARNDVIEKIIAPYISKGSWIISDRFVDSTQVYQGMVGQVGRDLVNKLISLVCPIFPDITILLDIDAAVGLERARNRGGKDCRFESRGLDYHNRIRQAFLELAEQNSTRIKVVDATQSTDKIHADILKHVTAWCATKDYVAYNILKEIGNV